MIAPFQLKTKDGSFRYGGQWLIKFKAPDGTWRREIGGATKRDAEAKLRGILTDIDRGVWVDPRQEKKEAADMANGPRTWGDVVDMFRKAKYTQKDQKNSRDCVKYTIQLFENGLEGSGPLLPATTPIAQLTKIKLRLAYDALSSFDLSSGTKNLRLTYLRMIFRWAIKHPAIPIDSDPTEGLERFKDPGSRSKASIAQEVEPEEVFTPNEVEAIVLYAREKMGAANAAMIETAFLTGMRRGELCGLTWRCVIFEKDLIHIRRSFSRKPKSGKPRSVPLTPELATTLKSWKVESPFSKPDDFVFPTPDGEMRGETTHWANLIKRAAKGAGVLRPGLSRFGHLTRHTYATQYLRMGGSDIMLAKNLGHKDTKLIYEVYTHWLTQDQIEDIQKIGFSYDVSSDRGTQTGTQKAVNTDEHS